MALPTQLRAVITPVAIGQAHIQYHCVKPDCFGAEACVSFAQRRNPDWMKFVVLGKLLRQKVAESAVIIDNQDRSFH